MYGISTQKYGGGDECESNLLYEWRNILCMNESGTRVLLENVYSPIIPELEMSKRKYIAENVDLAQNSAHCLDKKSLRLVYTSTMSELQTLK